MGNKTMRDVARMLAESSKRGETTLHETTVLIGDDTCVLSEDAFRFIESEWTKAQERYDLQSDGPQKALAQVTLLALGIEAGIAEDKSVIGPTEIVQGWQKLKVCGVGEFPHQCLGEAIVRRQMDFFGRQDVVGDVLRETAIEFALDIEPKHRSGE